MNTMRQCISIYDLSRFMIHTQWNHIYLCLQNDSNNTKFCNFHFISLADPSVKFFRSWWNLKKKMVPFDRCRIVHLWETLNRNILIIVKYLLIRTCFEIYLAINNDIETASNILWSDIFVSLHILQLIYS